MKKKKIIISDKLILILSNCGLLIMGVFYWMSVVMVHIFGTDYFYDVFFTVMIKSLAGKIIFIIGVSVLPILALGIDINKLRKGKSSWLFGLIIISGLISILGGLAFGGLFTPS